MFDLICTIFDMATLIIYFNAIFNGQRKKNIPLPVFFLCFFVGEMVLFLLSLFFSISSSTPNSIILLVTSLFSLFLQTYLYNGPTKNRILAVISFQFYATFAEAVVYLIISLLPVSLSETLLSDMVFCAFFSKVLLFLLVITTTTVLLRKHRRITPQYTILIYLTPIASFFVMFTIPTEAVSSHMHSFLKMTSCAGMLVLNIVNYFLLDNILQVKELEKTQEILDTQVGFQSEKYQLISNAYRNTRKLIHDTKKQFLYLQNAISEAHYEEAKKYLEQTLLSLDKNYSRVNTGNLVIDAFVSNHMAISKQEGILFETLLQIDQPNNLPVNDYDFSILLGNLLDNSLNTCRKIPSPYPRKIQVDIRTSSLELLIHISNSVLEETPKESKSSNENLNHGYGTVKIDQIARQHCGTYSHYIKDGMYHAIVILPFISK